MSLCNLCGHNKNHACVLHIITRLDTMTVVTCYAAIIIVPEAEVPNYCYIDYNRYINNVPSVICVTQIFNVLIFHCVVSRYQERSVGPNGFLDSSRYCHSFTVKSKRKTSPGPTGVTQSLSAPTSVSLSARIDQDTRDYDRRMKVIEVLTVLHVHVIYCKLINY